MSTMRRNYEIDKYDPKRNCLREILGISSDDSVPENTDEDSKSYKSGRQALILILECGHAVRKTSDATGRYKGPSLVQCKECQKDVLAATLQLRKELDELHLAEIRARQMGTVGKIGEV